MFRVCMIVVVFGLAFAGCGDKDRPPGLTTLTVTGAAANEESRTRLGRVASEWDQRGNPAQAVPVEVREPDPHTLPPYCFGCDPAFLGPNGSAAVGLTFPGASVVVARTAEWALYHELLHWQQWAEGWDADPLTPKWDPDVHHKDPRWVANDKTVGDLRAILGRPN